MKKNFLVAVMAGKLLALAAAIMMSAAFCACSGDDDNALTPQPKSEKTASTITIDGWLCP